MTALEDFAGHIGYALLVGGQIAVARGHSAGWIARLAGELIWIALGVALGSTSIVCWGLIGAGVEVFGLMRSRK